MAQQQKYIYNKHTLSYEVYRPSVLERVRTVLIHLFSIIGATLILFWFSDKWIDTPQERALRSELTSIKHRYQQLEEKLQIMEDVLDNLHERNSGVFRTLFGMEPIDENIWEGGVGGHKVIQSIGNSDNLQDLVQTTEEKINKLKRKLYLHSLMMDTVEQLTIQQEALLQHMPSIKPVREDKLKRSVELLSGFGLRLHPIHKVVKMHKGIDFTAPEGTDVIATGDGVVVRVKNRKYGYGKHIVIDHGYGYQTLYAHLSKVLVRKGQRVKRGQVIGKIGNTGTSTAPHLHYEVHYHGKAVNPIYYVMDGLTPEEYQELVDHASRFNQSFD